MKTVIIGGGIAGLAAAFCLNQAGMEVVVCERATEYSNAGLSFILLPNGLAALDQLGFGPAVRALGHPINRAVMRFADGSSIKDTPLEESLCITRYNFVNLLYTALPANLVVTGKRFSHFARRDDGTVSAACFDDGSVEAGDLFIGADGVRSLVRSAIFPDHQLSPVRVKELVCLVEAPEITAELESTFLKTYHRDGGLALGMAPCGAGKLVWYLQYDPERHDLSGTTAAEKQAFVANLVGAWPQPIPALLERTDWSGGHVWYTTDLNPLPRFSEKNVVLLGDAAHAFLTFTSQGVNSALQDAIALNKALGCCDDVAQAVSLGFADFERERREVVTDYLAAGRYLVERFLAPNLFEGTFDLPLVK